MSSAGGWKRQVGAQAPGGAEGAAGTSSAEGMAGHTPRRGGARLRARGVLGWSDRWLERQAGYLWHRQPHRAARARARSGRAGRAWAGAGMLVWGEGELERAGHDRAWQGRATAHAHAPTRTRTRTHTHSHAHARGTTRAHAHNPRAAHRHPRVTSDPGHGRGRGHARGGDARPRSPVPAGASMGKAVGWAGRLGELGQAQASSGGRGRARLGIGGRRRARARRAGERKRAGHCARGPRHGGPPGRAGQVWASALTAHAGTGRGRGRHMHTARLHYPRGAALRAHSRTLATLPPHTRTHC